MLIEKKKQIEALKWKTILEQKNKEKYVNLHCSLLYDTMKH
jgi:hypothetical protein